jgi:hypothetical protein
LPKAQITAADALVALEPDRPENYLLLAHAAIRIKDRNKFLSAAQSAVEKGGLPMREALEKIPIFQPMIADPQFQKILGKDKPR